ncbi:DUF1525 domain-containing protein [Microbulbifer sp. THAF38]|uniref:DUF1525 domain-containing protein n=1 Tax=Microbulbifer sp. THAF38 TaxID=2587856 RepID=UPI00126795A3|nr:DUF1525 domain-containing protein [Microbulbifer sp. THAF38]QFT57051.1 hypothetical protein FIU95_21100 [Microbulbifer sp. THAF38]
MNLLKLLVPIVALACASASAEDIYSIRIFQNDAIQVQQDIRLPLRTPVITHNLDAKEHSERKLKTLVKSKVDEVPKRGSVKEAYLSAFSDIQNGPQWNAIYQEIVASTEPEERAVRYGIKKIPAIVINDKYILYGIHSLEEAIRVYAERGKRQ